MKRARDGAAHFHAAGEFAGQGACEVFQANMRQRGVDPRSGVYAVFAGKP